MRSGRVGQVGGTARGVVAVMGMVDVGDGFEWHEKDANVVMRL